MTYSQQCRLARALEALAAKPQQRLAVVAEYDEPRAHVCVALRDQMAGEVTMPADQFDAVELAEITRRHGGHFLLESP